MMTEFQSMVVMLVVVIALGLEAILLKPVLYTMRQLLAGLHLGVMNVSWDIMVSLLPILWGVTVGILQRSHWKPASPLFWVDFIFMINVYLKYILLLVFMVKYTIR